MNDIKTNHKLKKTLTIFGINLALTFMGLEAISLFYYSMKEKQFFYQRVPEKEQLRAELENTGIRLSDSILERLHPYFGYVLKQGAFADSKDKSGLKVNRYGFFSIYDYPFVKANNKQVIIGVVGGSVAVDFVNTDVLFKSFSKRLKKSPLFADKEIIILNLAHGGFKQPQQVLILNYFLSMGQKFDMVINIDGFNEVAIGNINNKGLFDISMPSMQQIQPLTSLANQDLSPKVINSIAKVNQTKTRLKNTLNALDSCKIALCYALNSLEVNQLVKDYQKAVKKFNERVMVPVKDKLAADNIVSLLRNDQALPEKIAFDKMVNLWYDSSVLIQQTMVSQNIPYFHFIQPNQYYSTKRVFTKEELETKLRKNSPFAEGVIKGYPLLLSRVEKLRQANINAYSAVNLFDNTKETIYRDDCCHYNRVGRKMLANYVADQIIDALQKQ